MSQTETTTAEDHPRGDTFTITVNDDPVTLTDKHQTGAGIKAAAIAQGVPIQEDFALSEILPHDKEKAIADDKKVEIREGDAFWAIPGDDNS
jgi:hypothetical protein